MKWYNRCFVIILCLVCFLFGACSATTVNAEQNYPLKIWKQNENGSLATFNLIDDNTGVQYVVVTAQNYSNTMTVAITPRLNADGTLYTGD